MKTNKNNKTDIKSVSKTTESTLSKAVKNVKEILKNKDGNKEKKQKKLLKSLKEENIIKLNSEDSPALTAAICKKSPTKKNSKKKTTDNDGKEERGVVYIGHIPHGFYEEQMKKFFSQFGKVTNVRVSRSKVSGKSRGYGFIEFAYASVAKIAAESLNNYLMHGRLVKTEYIPPERQHQWYFRGLSYTGKSFPKLWNRKLHVKRINGGKIVDSNNLKNLVDKTAKSCSSEEQEERKLEVKKKLWGLNVLAGKLKSKGVKIDMKLGDVCI